MLFDNLTPRKKHDHRARQPHHKQHKRVLRPRPNRIYIVNSNRHRIESSPHQLLLFIYVLILTISIYFYYSFFNI